ncbi:MAG: hypothetical protein L3J61_06365, partial [Ghiorsea sp.]|nr:hypothetical protein [Ghiorsea sp.]
MPKIEALKSSAIGISLEIDAPLGFAWLKPHNDEIVYFIRVDHSQNMLQPSFIQSNYAKDGRIYLLNALPGEYMAIAYSYGVPTGSTSGPQSNRYLVYFSKDLVKQTHVSIGQGQIAFAGNYILSASLIGLKLTGMDYVQRHYRNIMNPNASAEFNPLAGIKGLFSDFGTTCEYCVSASYEYR